MMVTLSNRPIRFHPIFSSKNRAIARNVISIASTDWLNSAPSMGLSPRYREQLWGFKKCMQFPVGFIGGFFRQIMTAGKRPAGPDVCGIAPPDRHRIVISADPAGRAPEQQHRQFD